MATPEGRTSQKWSMKWLLVSWKYPIVRFNTTSGIRPYTSFEYSYLKALCVLDYWNIRIVLYWLSKIICFKVKCQSSAHFLFSWPCQLFRKFYWFYLFIQVSLKYCLMWWFFKVFFSTKIFISFWFKRSYGILSCIWKQMYKYTLVNVVLIMCW